MWERYLKVFLSLPGNSALKESLNHYRIQFTIPLFIAGETPASPADSIYLSFIYRGRDARIPSRFNLPFLYLSRAKRPHPQQIQFTFPPTQFPFLGNGNPIIYRYPIIKEARIGSAEDRINGIFSKNMVSAESFHRDYDGVPFDIAFRGVVIYESTARIGAW